MKNNVLASIALFGYYRNNNQDTYDLVAKFILATIAQKGYSSFSAATMRDDLKDLFLIDIPIGVIKSVSKNRIKDVTLNNGVFYCPRITNDEIEQEYGALSAAYDELFCTLLRFVKENLDDNKYTDNDIKYCFVDFLIDGYSSETCLNSLFAAFIAENKSLDEIRNKLDLLSSGLISYTGLLYSDSVGTSGAWTDKLTVYLDTEFLFSCAGYNGEYYKQVFKELFDLVREVNSSHRRRTKREEDLIELKYLKDTRDVYSSIFVSIKQLIEAKAVPDPSRKAMMKIYQESPTRFEVDIHKAKIDSEIKDTYHIIYDDNNYDSFITDTRYIIFDEPTVTKLSEDLNPTHDENTTRKIDYVSRVLTIINGLRKGERIPVFEKCRYIFLTGSRIGRSASSAVRSGNKEIALATDIDFLVSRLWFKLNKQLVNNRIPASLDIIARSQAVLTREVTRKVSKMYEDLVKSDLPESQKQALYANLKDAEDFLEPYNESSISDVLSFIDYNSIDELLEAHHQLKKKAAEVDEIDYELKAVKRQLIESRQEVKALQKQGQDEKNKANQEIHNYRTTSLHQNKVIKWLIGLVALLIICLVLVFLFK